MSDKLYKFGTWLFLHRTRVIIAWVIVTIVLLVSAVMLHKPYDPSLTIPGTKAQATLDQITKTFPAATQGSGTVVFAAAKGHMILENKAEIAEVLSQLSKVNGVSAVVSPFMAGTISPDGSIAFASVLLSKPALRVSPQTQTAIASIVAQGTSPQLQVATRGDIVMLKEASSIGEVAGIVVAALVLVMTFGSLIAAGMPLLVALIAVMLGMFCVLSASSFLPISSSTPTLAVMLGLAVGIDYTLFLLTRYISYLKQGYEPREATGRMLATAGNAVIFAALTVIIALAALTVVGIPFLTSMGDFAALTVAIAAVAALTLTPAILGFAKFKVLRKDERVAVARRQTIDKPEDDRLSLGRRWVEFVTRRPILVTLGAVLVLGLLALPATKLYIGLPDDGTAPAASTQRRAYDLIAKGFGPGFNGPLIAAVSLPSGLSPTSQQTALGGIVRRLKTDKAIVAVAPAGVSADGRTALLQIFPVSGPNDKQTRTLIGRLRADAPRIAGPGAAIALTGATAVAVDVDDKLAGALPVYLLVVVGLSLLILLMVFRSIVVPIKATLGFVLTIGATFGLMVMFFQWGWLGIIQPGPIISFLPILATGILFGLAMDYQFFLVSGMREAYTHGSEAQPTAAVIGGFVQGYKVVTAAAIIMASVFAGFIFASDSTVKSVGFVLASGVLIDAFIVRMTIVPAVMALFGERAWWLPAWLGRVLPNLSIEGSHPAHHKPE